MSQLTRTANRFIDYFSGTYSEFIQSNSVGTSYQNIYYNPYYFVNYNYGGSSLWSFPSKSDNNSNGTISLILFLLMLPILLITAVVTMAYDEYINYLLSDINSYFKELSFSEHRIILAKYKIWKKMFLNRTVKLFRGKLILFGSLLLFLSNLCFYNSLNLFIVSYVGTISSICYLLWYYITTNKIDEFREYNEIMNQLVK